MSASSRGKRAIPFVATDQEISHGRDIARTLRAKEAPQHIRESRAGTSWIVEMTATGTRDGKPFQKQHLFLPRVRTTPEALLQPVRDRWSIESWHWIRDTQLHEDAHRNLGNGTGVVARLPTAAWDAGSDARHHDTDAAGDCVATATAQDVMKL